MTAPRRRWFRFAFSLRTMFLLVTGFALWLGWQVRIVQERKAVIAELERLDWFNYIRTSDSKGDHSPGSDYLRISLVRRLLGDESCYSMTLPPSMGLEWIARAEVAFPEARLWYADYVDEESDWHEAFRDSLYAPDREPNQGTLFKTGLVNPNAPAKLVPGRPPH